MNNSPYPLKMALLLSSQSKASRLIEVPGNAIDYKLVVFCPDMEGAQHELEIYTVQDGKVADKEHRGMLFSKLDQLIDFISECGFVVNSGWTAEEGPQR